MNAISANGFAGRGRQRTGAFDALCCTLVMMAATAATYYVLALLLVAFVEQVTTIEALARAAWLSIHPAVLANLVRAQF
jgi:hypothetical protein